MFTFMFMVVYAAAAMFVARSITQNRLPEGEPMPQPRQSARYVAQTAAVFCTISAVYAFAIENLLLLGIMTGILQFSLLSNFIVAGTQPRFRGEPMVRYLIIQRATLFPIALACATFGGYIIPTPVQDGELGGKLIVSFMGAFGTFVISLCFIPLLWDMLAGEPNDQFPRLVRLLEKGMMYSSPNKRK